MPNTMQTIRRAPIQQASVHGCVRVALEFRRLLFILRRTGTFLNPSTVLLAKQSSVRSRFHISSAGLPAF
ncbi:MAG: hypothetical protein OEY77_12880 [Nitrospira sp.]|nr:hypothetical protein [Nitrospira sp.]